MQIYILGHKNNIKIIVGKIMRIHTHSNHFLASKYSERQKTIASNKYKSVIFLTKRIAGLSSINKIERMTRYDAIKPNQQMLQSTQKKQRIVEEQVKNIRKQMGGVCHPDKIKTLMKPVYRGKNIKNSNRALENLIVKSQLQTQTRYIIKNTYTSRQKNKISTITHIDCNKRKSTHEQISYKKRNFSQSGKNNLSIMKKKKIPQNNSQFSDDKLIIPQKNLRISLPRHKTLQAQKMQSEKRKLHLISTQNDDYICKSNRLPHHKSQITYQMQQQKKSQRRYTDLKQLQQYLDIDNNVQCTDKQEEEQIRYYNQQQQQYDDIDKLIPQKITKVVKKEKKDIRDVRDKQYHIPKNGLYMSMYLRMHNHTHKQGIDYHIKPHAIKQLQILRNTPIDQQLLEKNKKRIKKYLIKNYSFNQIHSMCKITSPRTNRSNDNNYKGFLKTKTNTSQQQPKNQVLNKTNNIVNISGKSCQKIKRNQRNSTIKSKNYFNNLKYRYNKNVGNLALQVHGPTIIIDPW